MTLLDAVRIARRFWMTIAACILLALGCAAAYAASQPRLYTASSQAFVSVPSNTERQRLRAVGGHQRRRREGHGLRPAHPER